MEVWLEGSLRGNRGQMEPGLGGPGTLSEMGASGREGLSPGLLRHQAPSGGRVENRPEGHGPGWLTREVTAAGEKWPILGMGTVCDGKRQACTNSTGSSRVLNTHSSHHQLVAGIVSGKPFAPPGTWIILNPDMVSFHP